MSFPIRYFYALSHRTHLPQPFCAVLDRIFAPYTSSTASLCGAWPHFCTVHFLHSLSVRCLAAFLHRTLPLQPFCAVPVRFFAPHTSSTTFLCGASASKPLTIAYLLQFTPLINSIYYAHRPHP